MSHAARKFWKCGISMASMGLDAQRLFIVDFQCMLTADGSRVGRK